MEIFGVVKNVLAFTERGWYLVETNIKGAEILKGVSITGELLTEGERVNVVQCDFQGIDATNSGYGFFKLGYEYSTLSIPYAQTEAVKSIAPSSYLLAYIARKAFNTEVMYGTGEITGFLSSLGVRIVAKVSLFLSATSTYLSFHPDLDRDAFKIGDKVLVSYWPSPARIILGWWETVPGEIPIPPIPIEGTSPVWRLYSDGTDLIFAKSYKYNGAQYNVYSRNVEGVTGTIRNGYTSRLNSSSNGLNVVWEGNASEYTCIRFDLETQTEQVFNFTQPDQAGEVLSVRNIAGDRILYLGSSGSVFFSNYDGSGLTDITSLITATGLTTGNYKFCYANGAYYLTGIPTIAPYEAMILDVDSGAYAIIPHYTSYYGFYPPVIWFNEKTSTTNIASSGVPSYNVWRADLSGVAISNETNLSGTQYNLSGYGLGVSRNGLVFDGERYAFDYVSPTRQADNLPISTDIGVGVWLIANYDY